MYINRPPCPTPQFRVGDGGSRLDLWGQHQSGTISGGGEHGMGGENFKIGEIEERF